MKKKFYIVIATIFLSSSAIEARQLIPNKDLVYLGSFRVPHETSQETNFGYNLEGGLTYDDSNGHLLMVGKFLADPTKVSAITTPNPIISSNKILSELNSAEYVSGYEFTDITNGKQINGNSGIELSDIQYFPAKNGQESDKLVWLMKEIYAVTTNYEDRLGWAETNFSNSYGTWHLEDTYSRNWDSYLLDIDQTWADANVGGKSLGLGRCKGVASLGPTLFATAPWLENSGKPPLDGSALSNIPLIYYPPDTTPMTPMKSFNRASSFDDAVWITINGKSAFVVISTAGFRTEESSLFFNSSEAVAYKGACNDISYLSSGIDDTTTSIPVVNASNFITFPLWAKMGTEHVLCTGKSGNTLTGCERGYKSTTPASHASKDGFFPVVKDTYYYGMNSGGYDTFPNFPVLLFYDTDQIAEIAAGTRQTFDIQPYAYLSLDTWFYQSEAVTGERKSRMTTGLAYDTKNQKIYISEYQGDGDYPLIHTFSVADVGTALDTTPPKPVTLTSNSGVLEWTTSEQGAEYVIFKYFDRICEEEIHGTFRPIDITQNTSWKDLHYELGDQYKIVAYDQSMNSDITYNIPALQIIDISIRDN